MHLLFSVCAMGNVQSQSPTESEPSLPHRSQPDLNIGGDETVASSTESVHGTFDASRPSLTSAPIPIHSQRFAETDPRTQTGNEGKSSGVGEAPKVAPVKHPPAHAEHSRPSTCQPPTADTSNKEINNSSENETTTSSLNRHGFGSVASGMTGATALGFLVHGRPESPFCGSPMSQTSIATSVAASAFGGSTVGSGFGSTVGSGFGSGMGSSGGSAIHRMPMEGRFGQSSCTFLRI
jgi:hypothetical protein